METIRIHHRFIALLALFLSSLAHGASAGTPELGRVGRQAAMPAFADSVAALSTAIGNRTAKDIIRYNNRILNNAIFSHALGAAETPAQIYAVLKGTVALWEPHAACHPKALGFFGARVPIASALCATSDDVHALAGLLVHRVLLHGYPVEAASVAAVLAALRIPFDDLTSTDVATPQGWVNVRFEALRAYFDDDGWNALGDRTRAVNRRPFSDPTGYRPVNPPQTDIRFPLRWTPLLVQADASGRAFSQLHSYPHIGWIARPLTEPVSAMHARTVRGPYNAPRAMSPNALDEALIRSGLSELLSLQRNLTRQQRYEATWWESKLTSLGVFAGYFETLLDLPEFDVLRIAMGDMLAQHDATIAVWRAKRAHDLVRPTTMMHRLYAGTRALAYLPDEQMVKEIDLGEWEPLLAAQPHSEFPSGSAAICRASLEQLHRAVEAIVGVGNVPPVQLDMSDIIGFVGLPPPFKVRFETLEQAYRNCGESRLWAGVHFPPAIDAGYEIVEGIGRAAFEHASALAAGRKPSGCERCHRA